MKRLNVGCGSDYKKGYINLDNDLDVKTDVLFDLNDIEKGIRMPFGSNTFDEIIVYDVLEHFINPIPILKELTRICKGIIDIKVPNGSWVWDNLDHKRQFSKNSFNVSNFNDYSGLGNKQVELIECKTYVLPSKNIIKKILRLFFKNNLRVKYKKLF